MLRRQSRDTNRNIKRSVYCQYEQYSLTFRALALRQRETSHKLHKYLHASRVSVHASNTFPFIAISNRFSRCLDHCIRSFRSLFESISIGPSSVSLMLTKGQRSKRQTLLSVLAVHQPFYISICIILWLTTDDLSQQGVKLGPSSE